jgi:hypothetical protein
MIPDDELRHIGTPTWLVTSLDDDTVPPWEDTIHAHQLIPGSLISLYDHVTWTGTRYSGHSSWSYVARNDPSADGTHHWPRPPCARSSVSTPSATRRSGVRAGPCDRDQRLGGHEDRDLVHRVLDGRQPAHRWNETPDLTAVIRAPGSGVTCFRARNG